MYTTMNVRMSCVTCRFILCFLLVIITWSQQISGKTCDLGWFGLNCEYKCHCLSSSCDAKGVCADSVCATNWFGPECQYQNLLTTIISNNKLKFIPRWLYDEDINTCNNDPTLKQLTISVPTDIAFTWLRLQVKEPSLLKEFQVTFKEQTTTTIYICDNMRSAIVNERTLDIHCIVGKTIRQVILAGEGVKSLCSLSISGGRNIALRQNTTLSSTYLRRYKAENAVDSYQDGSLESCASTEIGDPNPNINITFSRDMKVDKCILTISDQHKNLLRGFTLRIFTKTFYLLFIITEQYNVDYQTITLNMERSASPANQINIQGNTTNSRLALCELQVFGDSVCPPTKYGRECEYTCNCAVKTESCFVSTGGCPSGCSDGFQGESCNHPCDPENYGPSCNSTCSQFCDKTNISGSSCHNINGTCLQGCQSGYQPPTCHKPCDPGTYGQNCNFTCSQFCNRINSGSQCDPINGTCLHGCQKRYQGIKCEQICDSGKYDEACNSICSHFCKKTNISGLSCHNIDGTCLQGCQSGYQPPMCNGPCDPGTYGENCNSTCSQFCDRVTSGSQCDPFFGTCLRGCQKGYQGIKCEQICDSGKYGEACNSTCSQFCNKTNISGSSCHNIGGTCLQGCQSGYQPPTCYKPCDPGTYGENCNFTCSQFCNKANISGSSCDHIDGSCLHGCQSGFKAPRCVLIIQCDYPFLVVVVGSVAGTVVVLLTVALISVLVCKKRHKVPVNGHDDDKKDHYITPHDKYWDGYLEIYD